MAVGRIARAGDRAAFLTSLIQGTLLEEHDPDMDLHDVLERTPITPEPTLEALPPRPCRPAQNVGSTTLEARGTLLEEGLYPFLEIIGLE